MTLAKYFILAVTFLQLVPFTNGERPRQKLVARLTESRPTVYLTFTGTLTAQSSTHEPELMLVLHNSTRWLIHYHLLPGSPPSDLLRIKVR
jgi:hypothetical protein